MTAPMDAQLFRLYSLRNASKAGETTFSRTLEPSCDPALYLRGSVAQSGKADLPLFPFPLDFERGPDGLANGVRGSAVSM